jgi:hypothetical protein
MDDAIPFQWQQSVSVPSGAWIEKSALLRLRRPACHYGSSVLTSVSVLPLMLVTDTA